MAKQFVIEISPEITLSPEDIEYIFDCWVTFVTEDLGYLPHQLLMMLE